MKTVPFVVLGALFAGAADASGGAQVFERSVPALIKVKLKKYTPQKKAHLLFEDVKKLLPELVGASMTKGSADPKSGGHNEPYEFRFDLQLSGTLDQAKKRLYDTAQEIFFRNDRVVEVTHKLK